MDRYTAELAVVIVGAVWLLSAVLGPFLATIHPTFAIPVATMSSPDAALFRWRFSVNWRSPRIYLMLLLEAVAVLSWATWRREALRESVQNEYGIDIENYGND